MREMLRGIERGWVEANIAALARREKLDRVAYTLARGDLRAISALRRLSGWASRRSLSGCCRRALRPTPSKTWCCPMSPWSVPFERWKLLSLTSSWNCALWRLREQRAAEITPWRPGWRVTAASCLRIGPQLPLSRRAAGSAQAVAPAMTLRGSAGWCGRRASGARWRSGGWGRWGCHTKRSGEN